MQFLSYFFFGFFYVNFIRLHLSIYTPQNYLTRARFIAAIRDFNTKQFNLIDLYVFPIFCSC